MLTHQLASAAGLEASALAAASLLRGLSDSRRLLLLLTVQDLEEATHCELAEATGMPSIVIGRLLATMHAEGFLEAEGGDVGLRFTIGDSRVKQLVATLGDIFAPAEGGEPFRSAMLPGAETLSRRNGEGIWL